MAQSFYPSKHTGKEIDDAVDLTKQLDTTIENIVKVIPTSINKANNKIYLVHDGNKLTGQTDIALPECPLVDDGTELTASLLQEIKSAGCFLDETDGKVYYVG